MAEKTDGGGAEGRFAALLDEYGRLLHRTIADLCPRHLGLEVADIEQEARLRLWRALAAEREIQHPASYVYRVAVSTTVDAMRRARSRREESLPDETGDDPKTGAMTPVADPGESPDLRTERRRMLARIRQEVERLTEDGRRSVRLHLQGFTTREVGDLLGFSEAKARNLVYRGLEQIRQRLGAPGGDHDLD